MGLTLSSGRRSVCIHSGGIQHHGHLGTGQQGQAGRHQQGDSLCWAPPKTTNRLWLVPDARDTGQLRGLDPSFGEALGEQMKFHGLPTTQDFLLRL